MALKINIEKESEKTRGFEYKDIFIKNNERKIKNYSPVFYISLGLIIGIMLIIIIGNILYEFILNWG